MSKQVIVLRKDLNMRKGKMVAQGAHASLKAFVAAQGMTKWQQPALDWYADLSTKICAGIDGEEALLELHHKAVEAGLPCVVIRDAGLTEFDGVPTYTALAIGPADEDAIDAITGKLKLL